MKLKPYFCLLAILSLGLFAACETDEPVVPEPEAPVITLNATQMQVSYEGGNLTMGYLLENPIEGATLEVTSEFDWITDLDASVSGALTFSVLPNEAESPRESWITISYPNMAADVAFLVQQEAMPGPAFVLEDVTPEMTSFSVHVVPSDTDLPYICGYATKDYIEVFELESDAALFQNDLDYYSYEAQMHGTTLPEYLRQISHKGAYTFEVDKLYPHTEYVFYCYHLDFGDRALIGSIFREEILTGQPEQRDVTFDFNFDVQGTTIAYTVDPGDYDRYYFLEYFNTDEFFNYYGQDAVVEEIAVRRWNEAAYLQMLYGYAAEEILSNYCKIGTYSATEKFLADTEYVFYALAVDDESLYGASAPSVQYVVAGSVNTSNLTIEVEVSDIQSRKAVLSLTPSNDEDSYVGHCIPRSEWEEMGATEELKLQSILAAYSFNEQQGPRSFNLKNLTPDTDYVAFAFGYDSGTATTGIFTYEFRTLEDLPGECIMTVEWSDYYDVVEVSQYDPVNFGIYSVYAGYAFLPMYMTIEPYSDMFYYNLFDAAMGDYSEETWQKAVLQYPQYYTDNVFILPYDHTMTFVGLVIDSNGNYSPLCMEELNLSPDGVSDVAGFFGGSSAPTPCCVAPVM